MTDFMKRVSLGIVKPPPRRDRCRLPLPWALGWAAWAWLMAAGGVPLQGQTSPSAGDLQLLVCLRVETDPILTPLFVDALRRQVHDQLHNSLPGITQVNVLTTGHWLLDDYRGLPLSVPEFTAELFETRKLSNSVILVGIEYERAMYRIRIRNVDGPRAVAGPEMTSETPDRQWVARAVCLAVKRNLPVVAEVKPGVSTETVAIEFVSPTDKRQLAYLLGEESVFQPYAVFRRRSGELVRQPVPLTLLYWQKSAPPGLVKVVTNAATAPWVKRPGLVGWEAVRLATQAGRLRLQVLDRKSGVPIANCQISVNDRGFDDHEDQDLVSRPDREGFVFPANRYQHVAYVRVTQGGGDVYKFPVPILSDVAEQVVRITTDPQASAKADFDRRVRFLLQDVQALTALQEDAVKETNQLNTSKLHERARDRAARAVGEVDPLLKTAQAAMAEIKVQTRRLGWESPAVLKTVEERLDSLAKRHADLESVRLSLQKAIDSKAAQDRANVIAQLGQQLEIDGQIDDALQRYDAALLEQPEQPELKRHLDWLRETWRIKSPAHQQARTLIYEIWPQTDLVGVEGQLPNLERALETLKSVGDSLTARALSRVNGERIAELQAFVEQASGRATEEDRREAEKYSGLLQRLAELQEKVASFVADSLERDLDSADTRPAANRPAARPAEPARASPAAPTEEEEEPPK